MTRCALIWPTGSGLGVAVGTGVFVAAGAADPLSGVAVGLKELSVARGVAGASGIAVAAAAAVVAAGIAVAAGIGRVIPAARDSHDEHGYQRKEQ